MRELVCVVIRAKLEKTVVVEVERFAQHPRYKKVIRKRKCYMVHDEKKAAQVGAKVRIIESKPISKTKRWRLLEVVKP